MATRRRPATQPVESANAATGPSGPDQPAIPTPPASPTAQQLAAAGGTNITRTGGETTPFGVPRSSGVTGTPTPTAPAPPSATQQQDATNGQNASVSIQQTLASLGLGAMSTWAVNLAYSLAGQGIDPSTIVSTITSQLNNPTNSDGSVNKDALAAFDAAMPGFNKRIANGYGNGSPGSTPAEAIAQYVQYNAQIQQYANSAGLLPGTIDAQTIGTLWSGDVSPDEVNTRLTTDYATAHAAFQEIPGFAQHMQDFYGIDASHLASYYINPENTLAKLTTQFNATQLGAGAAESGFGALSAAQAQTLGAFLAPSSLMTAAQANNAFTSSLGNGMTGAAQMAKAGFEQALPGQANGPNVVTQAQLLGAVEGDAGALAEARRATETRSAGSRGGGGFAETTGGTTGLGFGSQQ